MTEDEKERLAEIVSTLSVIMIACIAALLFLSASVWIYEKLF